MTISQAERFKVVEFVEQQWGSLTEKENLVAIFVKSFARNLYWVAIQFDVVYIFRKDNDVQSHLIYRKTISSKKYWKPLFKAFLDKYLSTRVINSVKRTIILIQSTSDARNINFLQS